MLGQEVAALSHFFFPFVGTQYFMEIPEDIVFPSVYFPVPEAEGSGHSFSSYKCSFTLYLKVFHRDSLLSHSLAAAMVRKVQACKGLIPLYDADGNLTGKDFVVRSVKLKSIDVGVTQVMLSWDSVGAYGREAAQKSMKMFFNGLAAVKVKEVKDGEKSGGGTGGYS